MEGLSEPTREDIKTLLRCIKALNRGWHVNDNTSQDCPAYSDLETVVGLVFNFYLNERRRIADHDVAFEVVRLINDVYRTG